MELAPTLHDIAAMPFPASRDAMRKHYNPEWGMLVPEGAQKAKYDVGVSYMIRETETVTVEAFTEAEAREKALERVAGIYPEADDFDVRWCDEEPS